MRDTTLLFLIKKDSSNKITDICLAMKKRGFGIGRWNGAGGKVHEGESIEEALVRETQEEIFVMPKSFYKVAEIVFYFPANPEWDQWMYVYLCEEWVGVPTESEEMKPEWFKVEDIPFGEMWPDDPFWVPHVLKGALVKGEFSLGEKDSILSEKIEIVESL